MYVPERYSKGRLFLSVIKCNFAIKVFVSNFVNCKIEYTIYPMVSETFGLKSLKNNQVTGQRGSRLPFSASSDRIKKWSQLESGVLSYYKILSVRAKVLELLKFISLTYLSPKKSTVFITKELQLSVVTIFFCRTLKMLNKTPAILAACNPEILTTFLTNWSSVHALPIFVTKGYKNSRICGSKMQFCKYKKSLGFKIAFFWKLIMASDILLWNIPIKNAVSSSLNHLSYSGENFLNVMLRRYCNNLVTIRYLFFANNVWPK